MVNLRKFNIIKWDNFSPTNVPNPLIGKLIKMCKKKPKLYLH